MKILNVKWQDLPNETNYYRLFGQLVSVNAPNDTTYDDMWGDNTLYNDYEKDGNEIYSTLRGESGFYGSGYPVAAYDIYLFNIDEHYYSYQNSLDHYTYGDPFSEPSPLYTNIKGGLGIFAAYQKLFVRVP
jgi:hypothetical protein